MHQERVGHTVDDVVVTAERALDLRRQFMGVDHPVPVLDGQLVPYVNLDNAASTPALRPVVEAVEEFLPFYASVHRRTGYMSRLSTAAYEGRASTSSPSSAPTPSVTSSCSARTRPRR